MAKGMYIGVAGKARKVKKSYIGVNGIARKIKKMYIGVGGVARLAWSGSVPAGQVIFTSSQTWKVPDGVSKIDVFLVGGGASGRGSNYNVANGGGGGGYTKTFKNVTVSPNTSKVVTIGAGGNPGGDSSFDSLVARGALTSTGTQNEYYASGGSGGSGGGAGRAGGNNTPNGASGGEDGSDGGTTNATSGKGGVGQGTTTKAFGEPTGTLYAGGGGGGGPYSYGVVEASGGKGGGGAGGKGTGNSSGAVSWVNGKPGTPNTGSGGGGQGHFWLPDDESPSTPFRGGTGGSGIVIVRWTEQ